MFDVKYNIKYINKLTLQNKIYSLRLKQIVKIKIKIN